jgi:drug/metabolite transporter (DMT)-like permease
MATGKKAAAASISEPPARIAARRTWAIPPGAVALMVAVTLLWGINWPAMKIAVTEIPPWTFRSICVVGAGLTLLVLARLSGEPVRLERRVWLPLAGVAFFGVTLWHMFSAYGLMYMGSGRAAIIAFTMPLWTAPLSVWVLGEGLDRRRILGLVLGMGGMVALLGADILAVGQAPLGALLMLGAALVWALSTVGTKAVEWRMGTMALSGWQLLVGGLPIVALWPFLEPMPDLSALSWRGLLALLYVVFVALVFCFTAFLKIVRTVPANIAALSTLAIPIVGLGSSALLLGEPVGSREVAALVLVVAALALVLLVPERTRA